METFNAPGTSPGSIAAGTHLGVAALTVADLNRSVAFYEQAVGLPTLIRRDGTAFLGFAGERPLLVLVERPGARPPVAPHTGLYHVAILLPSRADLGQAIVRLHNAAYPISGASDHAVSEALYLDDPDGNGLEIYRDRPRETWKRGQFGIHMVTEPLDVEGILDAGAQAGPPPPTVPRGTRIGHLHLQVGDIAEAKRFYHGVLGFDVIWDVARSGALFVSAGGYHHHLGLNTWQSRNAPPAPPDATGLRVAEIILPDAAEQDRLAQRLADAGVPTTRHGDALITRDPWGNVLAFSIGPGLRVDDAANVAANVPPVT